jgi:anti-anti-sigma factor
MKEYEWFSVESCDGVTVLHLTQPLMVDYNDDFGKALQELMKQNSMRKMLVNFEGVSCCSSSVIGALVQAKQRLDASGGDVRLCCLPVEIGEKLQLLRLDPLVFKTHDNQAEGLAAFRR